MKKRILAVTAAVCLLMALTACGKEPQNNTVKSESLSEEVQQGETLADATDDTKNIGSEEGETAGNPEETAPEVEPEESLTF